jgi:hypothetical protein
MAQLLAVALEKQLVEGHVEIRQREPASNSKPREWMAPELEKS